MPYITNEGARIYWEQHGTGATVLLIMGLGFTHEMWFRLLPDLQQRYRVILFDNRGMGRSDVPRGPYSISLMARDARAVLDAAGARSAHVVGASMGGMIAQEIAHRWPERVHSLILACTSYSGVSSQWPVFGCVPAALAWARNDRLERERALQRLIYAPGTPSERIEEDLRVCCQCRWTRKGFLSQLAGILAWSSYRWLPSLRTPVLVAHGDRDRLIPLHSARVLARRLPGARFRLIAGAGHMLTTDQPETCLGTIREFLSEQSAA